MTEKEVKIDDEDMVSMSFSVDFKKKSVFWRIFFAHANAQAKVIIVFSMCVFRRNPCEFDFISNDFKNSKI